MKTITLLLLLAALLGARLAAAPATSPDVNLTIPSEARELARGYAQAFASLTRTPVTLSFGREGSARILEDVRSVKDAAGVLIVSLGSGLTYVISARDVLFMTDGNLPKTKG